MHKRIIIPTFIKTVQIKSKHLVHQVYHPWETKFSLLLRLHCYQEIIKLAVRAMSESLHT